MKVVHLYVDTLFPLVGGTILVLYPVGNLWDIENTRELSIVYCSIDTAIVLL